MPPEPIIELGLSHKESYEKLRALLQEMGIRVVDGAPVEAERGFPLALPLKNGDSLVLDLPEPGLLANLDPEAVGVAMLDQLGCTRRTWGLAQNIKLFSPNVSSLTSDIGPLLESAYDGIAGSLYLEGNRYYAANIRSGELNEVFVLVTNAEEEHLAKHLATKSSREAEALKRLGRVLSMNTQIQPLCVAAVHEIASAWELSAVLLWTLERDTNSMVLNASTGANRQGIAVLQRLSASSGSSCLAELVAGNMQPIFLGNVQEHLLTSELESRFCYLKPGGASIHPLLIGTNLLGVLEMIGRDGDPHFAEAHELFQTIAEHLALALNSAVMFESFERMAGNDPLTGIANHRTLHDFVKGRIAEAQRNHQHIGAIMIDVDHFRNFNEEEGHDIGDQVLKQVAETIRTTMRQYDLAARYGGEEFTAILPNANRETTLAIGERIRQKVSSIPIITRIGRIRHVTVSVGCAVYPACGDDGPSLIRAADQALFESKRSGRNRVVFFDHSMAAQRDEDLVKLEDYWKWVPAAARPKVKQKLGKLDAQLRALSIALGLSKNQEVIMRAVVIVRDAFEEARSNDSKEKLGKMERSEEFRLLLPSLHSIRERFDGKGPLGLEGNMIPLVARLLTVVLAMDEEGHDVLFKDSQRFDPEIVALMADLDAAA